MKFSHYLKRLEESSEFRDFKEKHKNSYLCAGFFVLDFETHKNMHQIDFALPNGKIATCILEEGVKINISKQALKKKLPEIKDEVKTDIDALKGIVDDEMKNHTVTQNIKKIIAVVQNLDGKNIWSLSCITDGLGLIQVHLDDATENILKFEKRSLFDFVKKA